MNTTITVSSEFKEKLASHGSWGERLEDILIRLLGKEWLNKPSGDRPTTTYSKEEVDSRNIKKKRIVRKGIMGELMK